jgi:hypothetical protein
VQTQLRRVSAGTIRVVRHRPDYAWKLSRSTACEISLGGQSCSAGTPSYITPLFTGKQLTQLDSPLFLCTKLSSLFLVSYFLARATLKLSHLFLGSYCYFIYSVSGVPEMYLRFYLISAVDFYYIINKLIILVSDPH